MEKARAEGVSRRLVSVVVDDPGGPAPMLWGGELVLRDGVPVGQLTSAAWGEALAAPVGLGYVRHPDGGVLTAESARGGTYQVSVGGRVCAATVTTRPPFDPAGARLQPG